MTWSHENDFLSRREACCSRPCVVVLDPEYGRGRPRRSAIYYGFWTPSLRQEATRQRRRGRQVSHWSPSDVSGLARQPPSLVTFLRGPPRFGLILTEPATISKRWEGVKIGGLNTPCADPPAQGRGRAEGRGSESELVGATRSSAATDEEDAEKLAPAERLVLTFLRLNIHYEG